MFAKFSPDAQKVAYVSNLNIYTEDLANGKIEKITRDGDDRIINGTFDWVYEEEFDCFSGFRWSPNGKYIAYWQSDTRGTGIFDIVNDIDSLYPTIVHFPYPKVGTTVSAVKVGVIPSLGGETKWFDIPGDSRDHYIPRMEFIPGSGDLMIQQMNRLQDTNIIWVGNAETMELMPLFTETDKAWVDVYDNTKWINESKFFTWTSERDGWRHLYLVSRDGKDFRLITKGDFDIVSIQFIDEKGGLFIILLPLKVIPSVISTAAAWMEKKKQKGLRLQICPGIINTIFRPMANGQFTPFKTVSLHLLLRWSHCQSTLPLRFLKKTKQRVRSLRH